jgi:hypothetical protein
MDWINLAKDRQMAGTYETGNEPLGLIQCEEFLDMMRTSYLLKKDSAAWSVSF